MSLTQYYTATTLDGFIADPDNSLDWLFTRQREDNGPQNYGDFIAAVGALAMGSTTYEWILDHEFGDKAPSEWRWPYQIPSWVFTHRSLPVVPNAPIEFRSGDVARVHDEMAAAAGDRNLWIVGGGDLVGQFADVGLLDEDEAYAVAGVEHAQTEEPPLVASAAARNRWSSIQAAPAKTREPGSKTEPGSAH